ncbi:MAG: hypothetical protein QXV01_10705, partial [Candidatus Bathyarchaeia archaeon]
MKSGKRTSMYRGMLIHQLIATLMAQEKNMYTLYEGRRCRMKPNTIPKSPKATKAHWAAPS